MFKDLTRVDAKTGRCPEGMKPCSETTSADNTFCIKASEDIRTCPIVSLKLVEALRNLEDAVNTTSTNSTIVRTNTTDTNTTTATNFTVTNTTATSATVAKTTTETNTNTTEGETTKPKNDNTNGNSPNAPGQVKKVDWYTVDFTFKGY